MPRLSNLYGIAVSGSNLFVVNNQNGTIGEYITSGAVVNAALVSGLSFPTFIAVSGSDLFVVDRNTDAIRRIYDVGGDGLSGLRSSSGLS